MEYMKYTTKVRLYNSYFDANDQISPKAILNIFQDVAAFHAETIGVGYKTMLQKNLIWVISRIKYDILKTPELNEEVIVETWPHEKGRVDFDRDIKITSTSGETLIIGTTKWCVVNLQTRRLERSDNINYSGSIYPHKNYNSEFNRLKINPKDFETQYSHIVRFSDTDHNKHLNNTNYATFISNAIQTKIIKHFEINFLNEAMLDDEISISTYKTNNEEYVIGSIDNKLIFSSLVSEINQLN